MCKCANCGKTIVNVYTWNGQMYGKECWKVIALPEIEKQRQKKIAEWDAKKLIAVEVAKIKDLTKIKSDSKKRIIKDIINFYNENGFISYKQWCLLTDQFDKKDKLIMTNMEYEIGLIEDELTYWQRIYFNSTGKAKEEANKRYYELLEAQ